MSDSPSSFEIHGASIRGGPESTDATFRALLEAAPDAMVVTTRDGRIILVNSRTEQLFGYPRQELLGQSVEVLVPERFHQTHVGHRQQYYQDPHARPMGSGLELWGRRKDGSEFPVEISLSPVATEGGTLVTAAVRDITERLRLEEIRREVADRRLLQEVLERRVAERTSELAAANRELEAFTYSVSHDLRAPLRQIDGFSRMLVEVTEGAVLPEDARHCIRRIQQGVHHMGRLVDDLLKLARLGRQEVRPRVVDLNGMLEKVIAELGEDLGPREIEWRLSPLPDLECDPGLIKVVLTNLLSNAIKYTRPRRPAVIEVQHFFHDGRPAIVVRDNGVGFNMKYADKLFGVFQRLHHADEFEGIGVGLATVQRIVHKHGGRLWAEAEPERGAAFYFTL